jgi:hypothetical protein
MTCEVFIGRLFLARDVAHSVHLNTKSYAKHKALQKFYEGVIELADAFAEAYQGRHGLIGPVVMQTAKKTTNIVEFLEEQLKEIEASRYKVCDRDDSALQNSIDEIVSLFLSTIYKLRFLA